MAKLAKPVKIKKNPTPNVNESGLEEEIKEEVKEKVRIDKDAII